MTNTIFFFITTIFLTIFSNFVIGLKGNYINRTFMDMPVNLIKSAVETNDSSSDEFTSYFNIEVLENNVNHYLVTSLNGQVDSYKISFFYFKYDENKDLMFDLTNTPQNVQIHFNCDIYKNFTLDKYLVFTIEELF